MPLNHTSIQGNLTRDPELKFINNEKAVASFTLANTHKFKQGAETKEETTFLDIETWGRNAELAQQYLTKGQPCIVEGRLKQDNWQDKDGNKRSKIKLVAERVHFLGGGKRQDEPREEVGRDGLRRNVGAAPASSEEAPF